MKHCYFPTPQEALQDCIQRNLRYQAPGSSWLDCGGDHGYYVSDVYCTMAGCNKLAVTADGLCDPQCQPPPPRLYVPGETSGKSSKRRKR
jgi:hypothetical protein